MFAISSDGMPDNRDIGDSDERLVSKKKSNFKSFLFSLLLRFDIPLCVGAFRMECIFSCLSTSTTLQINRNRLHVDIYYSEIYKSNVKLDNNF